jgi:hypothetical protein
MIEYKCSIEINMTKDYSGSTIKDFPERGEAERRIAGFKTARGSVYTYDEDGKVTRFKTATGEQKARSDITVFADLTGADFSDYLFAIHESEGQMVHIIQKSPDNSGRVIRDVNEVTDPNNLILAITDNNKTFLKVRPCSLVPAVGRYVYENRRSDGSDPSQIVRHMGHQVVEIF